MARDRAVGLARRRLDAYTCGSVGAWEDGRVAALPVIAKSRTHRAAEGPARPRVGLKALAAAQIAFGTDVSPLTSTTVLITQNRQLKLAEKRSVRAPKI